MLILDENSSVSILAKKKTIPSNTLKRNMTWGNLNKAIV